MTNEDHNVEPERDYVIDPEEGLKLDENYFYGDKYDRPDDRIKIMTPALFFGIMLLVVVSGFGLFFVNSFG